jgi:2-oxoisovalerate dehydrogenase E1 component beta subunit
MRVALPHLMEETAEVIDLRTLHPLDKETILNPVCKTGKAVIIHEDNLTGGLSSEIAAIIAQEAFAWLDGRIAWPIPTSRACPLAIPLSAS